MAAMLCDVVVARRTRSMPLAILTIRKELRGFLFLFIRVVPFSIYGAPLGGTSSRRSSAVNSCEIIGEGWWLGGRMKIIHKGTGLDL